MLVWLGNNMGTIGVALVLAAVAAKIVAGLIKNKRKGKSACGCNCAHCAMAGSCHKPT